MGAAGVRGAAGLGQGRKKRSGVVDALLIQLILQGQDSLRGEAGGPGQGTLGRIVPDPSDEHGQVPSGGGAFGVEDFPILLGEDGDFERIAGQHFQLEEHFGVFLLEAGDDAGEVQMAVAEGNLRQQDSIRVEIDADILKTDEDGVRRKGVDGLLRGFDEGDVVDEIECDPDVLAAGGADPGGKFLAAPAFVVFDRKAHFVFAQDRLGEADAGFAGCVKAVEFCCAFELFVAATGERIVDAFDSPTHFGAGFDGGFVLGEIGFGAGSADEHNEAHIVLFDLTAQFAQTGGIQICW